MEEMDTASTRYDVVIGFMIIEGNVEVSILDIVPIGDFKILGVNHDNHD